MFYFFVDETEVIVVDRTGQIQVIDFFESHLHELN